MSSSRRDTDHAIVGAGVSGLTLAHYLAESGRARSITILDRDDDPNYNISFWLDGETPFEPIMRGRWQSVAVRHGRRTTVCPLRRYCLRAFWRDDFDRHLRERLLGRPGVAFEDVSVTDIVDRGDHAEVLTTRGALRADWAFDSRPARPSSPVAEARSLVMQGLAVEIECATPTFDPGVATLFDFLLDTAQLDFMYVLPYTPHSALVNVALLTDPSTTVSQQACTEMIAAYVHDRLGCQDYRVTASCYGRLRLAERHPERVPGRRVVPIGARAGMMKASTSYAFTRILRDSRLIARALAETGQPYRTGSRPRYYRWADELAARAFVAEPKVAQEVMFTMFSPRLGDLALAFLDERTTLADNRRLLASMPARTAAGMVARLALGTLKSALGQR